MAKNESDLGVPTHYESGIPLLPGPAERAEADRLRERTAEQQHRKVQSSIQRGMLFTQVFLVIFGLVGAVVSILQARVAQQGADSSERSVLLNQKAERDARLAGEHQFWENKREFEENLNQIEAQTLIQRTAADAAKRAANEAASAVQVAKDSMFLEQRPWVGIEITYAERPGPSQTPWVRIFAHNTGRTPALQFRNECCKHVTREREEPVGDYDSLNEREVTDLPDPVRRWLNDHPDQEQRMRQAARDFQSTEEASFAQEQQTLPPNDTREVDDIVSGPMQDYLYHFIVGKFVYTDAIDPTREHSTQYCLVNYRAAPLRLCRNGQGMN